MTRIVPLLCLLAVLPLAGCYAPDYAQRPQIVRADATGIVIVAGTGYYTYNIAALHCQHYGKLSVLRGSDISGAHERTYFYACQ
ncbi:MAG: hypothetical protein KGJ66_08465 [Alphaproteobacteria bacterium]|jgi:hypothetical protein|nr:hypothetical protein [Alphaproteobacteria bacterium]